MHKGKVILIIYTTLLSVLVIFISHSYQDQITFNDGLGWDGVNYYKMAEQFAEGEQISAKAPFVYRIGVPWLVSNISPENLRLGFLIVNWTSSVLNAILLSLLLLRFISKHWRVYLLVTFYITQWHNYFRFGSFYPIQVDSLALTLLLISFFFLLKENISKNNIFIIAIITIIGIAIREILIIPALLLFLKSMEFNAFSIKSYGSLLRVKQLVQNRKFWILVSAILVVTIVIRYSVFPTNSYKFYNAATAALYTKSMFRYVHSWLVAYGPFLILPIIFYRQTIEILKEEQLFANYLFIIIIIAFIGGADTERLAYWAFPAKFFVVAKLLDKFELNFKGKIYIWTIIVLQFFSQRLIWSIPDYPNNCVNTVVLLTPLGNCFPYLNLFPAHSELIPAVIGFAEWIVLFVILLIWGKRLGVE